MTSGVFLRLALGLAGAAAFLGTWTALRAPTRPAARLGRRGRRRMASLATNPSWARVEPLVRWTGVRVSAFLPEATARALDRQIVQAGDFLGLLPEEYVALTVLCGLVGAAAGAALDVAAQTHGLVPLAFTVVGLFTPYLKISGEAQERTLRITRGLPYAVDTLTLCMGAGLDFPGSVRQYVTKALPGDPLADELELVLQMLQLGHTRRSALEELAERVPSAAVREFVHTVIHAEEKGHPLAEALTIQAQVSRMRRSVRAEEAAAKAGVAMLVPLALIVVALLLLVGSPLVLKLGAVLSAP